MSDSPDGTEGAAALLAPDDSDPALLHRIAAHDEDAFDLLYERHVRTVYRAALARMRSVPDAEELAQETFLTLWRRAASIDVGDSLLPWLLATTRYLALNRLRADASHLAHHTDAGLETRPDTTPGPDERYEQVRLAAAIAAAVGGLSGTDQALYRLCIEDELGYAEAAARLGISHGAVRNRLSRVRKTLREDLEDHRKGGRA